VPVLEERLKAGTHPRLDAFHGVLLDVPAERFREPGIHVIVTERRARPGWGGYITPIYAISTPLGGVVSCRADLVGAVRRDVSLPPSGRPLGDREFSRLRAISQRAVPYAYCLTGDILYVDRTSFKPVAGTAQQLARSDPRGAELRRRFDGEIFVVSGLRGEIAAWSAVKLKSDEVWEIAVVTEAAYRGRGLAKRVVAASTAYILDHGRVPLYVHVRANVASARVCRALGYSEYAQTFFCEY
jgi:RimJ/RimL family protein N-acetyltransferase